ncbi:MAG: PEP-CTERM sorting domain-containing protein, partial [Akkermansia sp.]|nr:PEP-CTERM sorting domain-containing protein [Akkermansia sp.]
LTSTQDNVVISNRRAGAEATLRTNTQTNDSEYAVNNEVWELTNAHIIAKSASASSLLNKLVDTSVENAGSGKLTVSNAANSITDVYASAGDMAIMQQAAGLNLEELVVAADKTVSAYTGANAIAAEEADVTVRGHAEFGKGAVLNANLTLASGSSLSVAEGGLAMGSTLSLSTGITLDDTTLNRVYSLNTGESLALFTGVDGLKLGETSYTSISENDEILASPYFTNLNSDQYRLTYTGTDNGTLSILSAAVPEPATATLSLLALAALAARRRRK